MRVVEVRVRVRHEERKRERENERVVNGPRKERKWYRP